MQSNCFLFPNSHAFPTPTHNNPKLTIHTSSLAQLETFAAWAGRDSDISYYLNSHHVDICDSMAVDFVPTKVTGSASKGIATDLGCVPECEDTITLLVEWRKKGDPSKIAHGSYTASWTAPKGAGVHSNQYFHCTY